MPSARAQPQVLNRAHGAVEIHVGIVGSAQNHVAIAGAVAGDADVERRLADTFEFQRLVFGPPFLGEHFDSLLIGGIEGLPDCGAARPCADGDEIPRLHEPDRGRVVRGFEHSADHRIGDRFRQGLIADIAACEYGFVDGVLLVAGKTDGRRQRVCLRHCLIPNNP